MQLKINNAVLWKKNYWLWGFLGGSLDLSHYKVILFCQGYGYFQITQFRSETVTGTAASSLRVLMTFQKAGIWHGSAGWHRTLSSNAFQHLPVGQSVTPSPIQLTSKAVLHKPCFSLTEEHAVRNKKVTVPNHSQGKWDHFWGQNVSCSRAQNKAGKETSSLQMSSAKILLKCCANGAVRVKFPHHELCCAMAAFQTS